MNVTDKVLCKVVAEGSGLRIAPVFNAGEGVTMGLGSIEEEEKFQEDLKRSCLFTAEVVDGAFVLTQVDIKVVSLPNLQ